VIDGISMNDTNGDDVRPWDAQYAHDTIAGSEPVWIDQASHIGFRTAADAEKVRKYTIDWLKNRRKKSH
jgi:hypothetical protein